MSGQFFVRQNHKYLKIMDNLNAQIKNTKNKQKQIELIRLQSSYFDDVLQDTQARDYTVIYDSEHLNDNVFTSWTTFISKYPIQLHTALLANPHLTPTDKLVGGIIDTYIAFAYLTFINMKFVTVYLKIIAVSANLSLNQVEKSVKKLGTYGGFFDKSSRSGN